MTNILGKQDTLCWHCARAIKKCPWNRRFKPVEGWDAVPTDLNRTPSYFVRDCPLFKREAEREDA